MIQGLWLKNKNQKKGKWYIGILLLLLCFGNVARGYFFWLVSADHSLQEIKNIESGYEITFPLIGYIFDGPNMQYYLDQMDLIAKELGTWRVYTITLAPYSGNAQAVAEGMYDDMYLSFFSKVKNLDMKIIFRTMHEMNGWWYPRWSNPQTFKNARIHIRNLSRDLELNQKNLLFDFSINHWDMPTKWIPSQKAQLFQCDLIPHAERINCPKFEDYYPGDQYVDLIGFSFYNRWKANSNRLRLSPEQILYEKRRNTFERLKKLWKPLIIDEVGTSSIRYNEPYSKEQTKTTFFQADFTKKEEWLLQLQQFVQKNPEIMGVSYFNIDYTNGYQYDSFGEGDWAIVDLDHSRFFNGFFSLLWWGETDISKLFSFFTVDQEWLIQKQQEKETEKSDYIEEGLLFHDNTNSKEFVEGEEKNEFDELQINPPQDLSETVLLIDQMVSKKYPQKNRWGLL